MDSLLFWLIPAASVLALCFAYYFHKQMMKESEGTPQMIKIAAAVRKGAMSYLKQQYKIVGWVFLGLVILFAIMAYGFDVQNRWVPIAFLTGGFFSGLSGFLGMKTATYASARTANAARSSLNAGLRVAFRSGAVMGLVVVGLGLLDISFWYLLLNAVIPEDVLTPTHKLCIITTTMLTFGMGASTQALFARVGGGIYTKAADVGADLVGKVEAGIPEDDPRNPATIADNVGDNVGDVAGMGADLYESYCGSILATAALGAAAFIHTGDTAMQFKAVIAPMLIAAVGILLSIIGIFAVRTKENAKMKDLLASLALGTNLSSVLIVVATFFILWLLKLDNWMWISCAVIVGLVVGIIIGRSTEYYTSQSYRPTQKLSESGKTGPATVIISGIGLGMLSTAIPVIAVVVGIIASYLFASGFDFNNVGMGLYGIGIAAVGMLSAVFAMHDKKQEKIINESKQRVKELENLYDLIDKKLEYSLGSGASIKLLDAENDKIQLDKVNARIDSIRRKDKISIFDIMALSKYSKESEKLQKRVKAYNEGGAYGYQRALMQEQMSELEKQRQAEIDKKKTDDGKVTDYENQIAELKQQIKDFAEEMADSLYGINLKDWASQLGDALYEAWQKGEDGAEAFKKKAAEIMGDVMNSVLKLAILEPAMKNLQTMLFGEDGQSGMFGKDFKLDNSELENIADYLMGVSSKTDDYYDALDKLNEYMEKKYGVSMKEEAESSGLSKGIEGVTEDTANLLASYLNSVRSDVAMKLQLVRQIVDEHFPRMNLLAEAQLTELKAISRNTSSNVVLVTEIRDMLSAARLDKNRGFYLK